MELATGVVVNRPPSDARTHFHGQKFLDLMAEYGYDTYPKLAELLDLGVGTVHRACKDQFVTGKFVLRVRLILPSIPYEDFFWEA